MHNLINFSNYINRINEGLIKTHNGEDTVNMTEREMDLMSIYDFNIKYAINNNTIHLTLNKFNLLTNLFDIFKHINSMLINRYGWFPSIMKIENISGNKHTLPYNEVYLVDNKKYLSQVSIIYESKFDIEVNVPIYLYHISTQSYENKILNNGIIPKSKSKLSKHLDRIYVCKLLEHCKSLIPRMKLHNIEIDSNDKLRGKLPNRNNKWIIYKIDTRGLSLKLYKDPNYEGGYYLMDNIPKESIIIIDKEI